MSPARVYGGRAFFGLMLGWVVTRIGFGDYGQLNQMFTFGDLKFGWGPLRMFLSFAVGVAIAGIAFQTVLKHKNIAPKIHKGVVPGAILFGIGWAISGGCPAIPVIQLASGYLPALVTIGGVVIGIYACRAANSRWFHFDSGSCSR
jgi:uncharacterized protein